MATFIKLTSSSQGNVVEISYKLHQYTEINRHRECRAATKIQTWYRGLRTRHYLRYLNQCAVTIQRTWRGYMGKMFCRIRVKNLVMIARNNFYNAMAVRIQKYWRGFYARKHIHDFYTRKRYLEALVIKNQIVRQELEEYQTQIKVESKKLAQHTEEKRLQLEARKHHYLLSTFQRPGIYNSPFNQYPHDMEFRLRAVKYSMKAVKGISKGLCCSDPMLPIPPPSFNKIQGPFLSPKKVMRQRLKPLNPSLRVATDYYSVEQERERMVRQEWTERLSDIPFVGFRKKKEVYQPLLHTTSKYGHLAYGTKCFIEENKALHITEDRMQTVVSPVPIFDKVGKTYSKGAVVLQ